MRPPLGLVLGALLGVARADRHLLPRQNTATPTASATGQPPAATSENTASPSAPGPAPNPTPTPNPGGGGGGGGGDDVTVTSTVLTTVGAAGTTQSITVTSTTTTFSTVFSTTTVTGDQPTATTTVFVTSTVFVDQKRKRAIDEGDRPSLAAPAHVSAAPTPPAADGSDGAATSPHVLVKRATKTETVTSTVSASRAAATVTATSYAVKSGVTTVVTQTDQPNAQTTVTTTNTLTVTSTRVSSLVEGTATEGPGGDGGASGGGDEGLSTGAKAGIGVGAAVGALALLGVAVLLCLRRRKGPKPVHDDFMGASEVPVGGSGPVSQPTPVGGYVAPSRSQHKPEGYRGMAMGDGRAGYANNLTPYGSAYTPYTPSRSTTLTQHHGTAGDNHLPRHPTPGGSSMASPVSPIAAELGHDSAAAAAWNNAGASEIDGQAVTGHDGGPVFEMPAQGYW